MPKKKDVDESPDNSDTNKLSRRKSSPYKVVVRRRSAKSGTFVSKKDVAEDKATTVTTRRMKAIGSGFIIVGPMGMLAHGTFGITENEAWHKARKLTGIRPHALKAGGCTCVEVNLIPRRKR
jgi:hypothetical protein